jgi:predicted nucleic acid-binding Zn finger protein
MLKTPYIHMNNGRAIRIEETVNLGSVKLHVFSPSGREIWTVVGKDDEHWADPELHFCSCRHYYYKTMSNDEICYHIKSIEQARQDNKFVRTDFDDSEYNGFLKILLLDNTANLLS